MTTAAESLVTRRANITPSRINVEQRTAEVIFSTGARMLRGTFDRFYEELSLDPKHVRMTRLNSGAAPVLAAHNGDALTSVIGVVEHARLEAGQGIAALRFAKDDPVADAAWNKIAQGILRSVSIGYVVHRYEPEASSGDERIPVLIARDWEPYEVSVVPMPADAGAMFRAAARPVYDEIHTMEPTAIPDPLIAPSAPSTPSARAPPAFYVRSARPASTSRSPKR